MIQTDEIQRSHLKLCSRSFAFSSRRPINTENEANFLKEPRTRNCETWSKYTDDSPRAGPAEAARKPGWVLEIVSSFPLNIETKSSYELFLPLECWDYRHAPSCPAVLFFHSPGFELRAFTLSHSTSSFLWETFLEIGSLKLFAQAGFEPRSSWSLPPE
jgi:hypothetical protein